MNSLSISSKRESKRFKHLLANGYNTKGLIRMTFTPLNSPQLSIPEDVLWPSGTVPMQCNLDPRSVKKVF